MSITLESLSFRARKIINICFNLYFEVCKYVHICIGAGLLICVFNCLSLTLENWKVWNLWLVLIQDFFHFLKIESFVISRLFCNKIPWNYFFLVNSKVEFHCFFFEPALQVCSKKSPLLSLKSFRTYNHQSFGRVRVDGRH